MATGSRNEGPYTLWGVHPDYAGGVPIKLMAGTNAECNQAADSRNGPWMLRIQRTGESSGLPTLDGPTNSRIGGGA